MCYLLASKRNISIKNSAILFLIAVQYLSRFLFDRRMRPFKFLKCSTEELKVLIIEDQSIVLGTSVIHSDVPTIEDDTPNTASTIIVQHVHRKYDIFRRIQHYYLCFVCFYEKYPNVKWTLHLHYLL